MARPHHLTMNKTTNEVISEAIRDHGAVVTNTKSGHIKVTLPNGRSVIVGKSPSDKRAADNTRAYIRRALKG